MVLLCILSAVGGAPGHGGEGVYGGISGGDSGTGSGGFTTLAGLDVFGGGGGACNALGTDAGGGGAGYGAGGGGGAYGSSGGGGSNFVAPEAQSATNSTAATVADGTVTITPQAVPSLTPSPLGAV